jgi:hypothetical protein
MHVKAKAAAKLLTMHAKDKMLVKEKALLNCLLKKIVKKQVVKLQSN